MPRQDFIIVKLLILIQQTAIYIYKIAGTYMNEGHWESAVKNIENAMRINKSQPDYHFALAKCYMQLKRIKEAVIHFSNFIKARPKNANGWKELIKCLYDAGYFEEALEQVYNAQKNTIINHFLHFINLRFYLHWANPKKLCYICEIAMQKSPTNIKQFVELNPSHTSKSDNS